MIVKHVPLPKVSPYHGDHFSVVSKQVSGHQNDLLFGSVLFFSFPFPCFLPSFLAFSETNSHYVVPGRPRTHSVAKLDLNSSFPVQALKLNATTPSSEHGFVSADSVRDEVGLPFPPCDLYTQTYTIGGTGKLYEVCFSESGYFSIIS